MAPLQLGDVSFKFSMRFSSSSLCSAFSMADKNKLTSAASDETRLQLWEVVLDVFFGMLVGNSFPKIELS